MPANVLYRQLSETKAKPKGDCDRAEGKNLCVILFLPNQKPKQSRKAIVTFGDKFDGYPCGGNNQKPKQSRKAIVTFYIIESVTKAKPKIRNQSKAERRLWPVACQTMFSQAINSNQKPKQSRKAIVT